MKPNTDSTLKVFVEELEEYKTQIGIAKMSDSELLKFLAFSEIMVFDEGGYLFWNSHIHLLNEVSYRETL